VTPPVVRSPVPGRALPLAEVPDPVFAEAMVGPGAAVEPAGATVDALAPVDGTLAKLHPHAFVVAPAQGPAVLVHLGIDTVQLAGAPFTVRAREGETVRAGDVVVSWDVAATVAAGRSPVVPVIVLEAAADDVAPVAAVADRGTVAAGDPLLHVTLHSEATGP
jgi:PTS system glucose-specific IIA component